MSAEAGSRIQITLVEAPAQVSLRRSTGTTDIWQSSTSAKHLVRFSGLESACESEMKTSFGD